MSVEAAIYNRLQSQSGIANRVGTRIYPAGTAPQDAPLPFIQHAIQSGTRDGTLSGRQPLVNYSVQITGFMASHADMRGVMDKVLDSLDGWAWDGRIQRCRFVDKNTNDNPEQPELYSESHTYSLWYVNEI